MSVEKFRKVKNPPVPAEPPLSPAALEVLWALVHPQSEMRLAVPVGRTTIVDQAVTELRAWAKAQIDTVLQAQKKA